MAKIFKLEINNFRGIKKFSYTFNNPELDNANLICLVGRGDTGKTTILKAISYALYPNWNLQFYDTDFYNCDINNPIEITVTLVDIPEKLLTEDKYGLYIRGINKKTKIIKDEIEDDDIKALTIKLKVQKDLEPEWQVVNNRANSPKKISHIDRSMLNAFMISDYIDSHFYWRRNSPLYSLLKSTVNIEEFKEGSNLLIDVTREVQNNMDAYSFKKFNKAVEIIQSNAGQLGVKIPKLSNSTDFKDIYIKEGRISLHENKIPLRLKGKGNKRLISIAIQMELVKNGGIVLIDEIEQGLEPDRVKHLVRMLYKINKGQIFITTHSQNVIEEIEAEEIFLISNKNGLMEAKASNKNFQDIMRACPEAAYAKKVIACEGKTEIGICRALDNFRINNDENSMSELGIVYTYGSGDDSFKRADKLNKLGLITCVLCDSDKDETKSKKEEASNSGIDIFDWDKGNCIEQQVFFDLPWEAIKELIDYRISISSEESIKDSVKSKYTGGEFPDNWKENDSLELREALMQASISKKKEWFKRIDHGEFLGTIIFKYFEQIKNKKLGKTLKELSKWIDK